MVCAQRESSNPRWKVLQESCRPSSRAANTAPTVISLLPTNRAVGRTAGASSSAGAAPLPVRLSRGVGRARPVQESRSGPTSQHLPESRWRSTAVVMSACPQSCRCAYGRGRSGGGGRPRAADVVYRHGGHASIARSPGQAPRSADWAPVSGSRGCAAWAPRSGPAADGHPGYPGRGALCRLSSLLNRKARNRDCSAVSCTPLASSA